jgi:F5/8 type C domain-containing protein
MRKRTITQVQPEDKSPAGESWLDLERLAQVEVTSEAAEHPIESALIPGPGPGWRAAQSGEQTIRLVFDAPQRLEHIRLLFHEDGQERTQQFVLRWSDDGGRSYREIVRQQFNFNPSDTTREVEDFRVKLEGVTTLELKIVPDISGGGARASLERWQVA